MQPPVHPRRRALAGVLALLAALATLALPLAPAAAAPQAGQYVQVAPTTVVNNVSVPAGGTTTATVTNLGGVPAAASVSAVAVNVIANQPAANGHLQLFAAGATRPVDSTLNYAQGQTTAGFETVPVSSSGQISIFSTAATKVIVRLRGWYASAASTVNGARFVPVPPATVVSNLSLAAGGTTTFRATGATGANGIPASPNVKAIALNVIANQPTASGHLQVYPADAAPPVDSTLNFQAGRTAANHEVVRVPSPLSGGLSIFTTAATKVIVRVRGYWTVSPHTDEGGTYTPVAPATVVNNVSVPAGGITSLRVTGANGIPAPAEVSAVAVNVVANQPGGAGWLQAYPEGDRPVDSTLNFQQGRTTANFEAVPVPADGRISIFSTTATRVIVRLRGWYSTAPPPEGADWEQFRNGPAHPGTNDAEPVLTPSTVSGLGQAWAAVAGTPIRSEPAVVGQVVYAAALNGTVHALDAATGATIWTAAVGGELRASPAVVGGVVYVGSINGRVHALNAATGTTVWTATTGGSVIRSPAVVGGVVYVGSTGNRVHALNAATGAQLWMATIGAAIQVDVAVAVAAGAVYARSLDGNLYALDAATGAGRWTADIGGRPNGPGLPSTPTAPVVADGRVYVAGPYDAVLYALDAATGASVWTAASPYGWWDEPVPADGVLYAPMARGVGSCDLRALDAATGANVWTIPGGPTSCVASNLTVVNGILFHSGTGGVLAARNAATGAVLKTDSQTPGRPGSGINSVVVANGAVYATREGLASPGYEAGLTAHHP